MNAIIDLGSKLLVNSVKMHGPQLRCVLAAIGQPVAQGSPWIVVDKVIAALYPLPLAFLTAGGRATPAARVA